MEKGKGTLSKAAPWKSGVAWWLVLVQGIIALVLGVYLIVEPLQAVNVFGIFLAIVLLINGAIAFFGTLRATGPNPLARWRGIIGIIVGAIILVIWLIGPEREPESGRTLMGNVAVIVLWVGLIAYGILGLILAFTNHEEKGLRLGTILGSLIFVLIGLLAFFDSFNATFDAVNLIGALMVILGVVLIIFAFGRRMMARPNAG